MTGINLSTGSKAKVEFNFTVVLGVLLIPCSMGFVGIWEVCVFLRAVFVALKEVSQPLCRRKATLLPGTARTSPWDRQSGPHTAGQPRQHWS